MYWNNNNSTSTVPSVYVRSKIIIINTATETAKTKNLHEILSKSICFIAYLQIIYQLLTINFRTFGVGAGN